jgi:hypothetical protein
LDRVLRTKSLLVRPRPGGFAALVDEMLPVPRAVDAHSADAFPLREPPLDTGLAECGALRLLDSSMRCYRPLPILDMEQVPLVCSVGRYLRLVCKIRTHIDG